MPTISEVLQQAIEHQRAGRLQEAEQLYRQILVADPQQPDALHLLGVLHSQLGRYDTAAVLIAQAVALNPNQPAYLSNLGEMHRRLGQLDQALAILQAAKRLAPTQAMVLNNLGLVLEQQGRWDEAAAAYDEALHHDCPRSIRGLTGPQTWRSSSPMVAGRTTRFTSARRVCSNFTRISTS